MDFVEICNVYVGKMVIKAATTIFNSDKICRSYSDFNFGVTFFGTQCIFSANFSKKSRFFKRTYIADQRDSAKFTVHFVMCSSEKI